MNIKLLFYYQKNDEQSILGATKSSAYEDGMHVFTIPEIDSSIAPAIVQSNEDVIRLKGNRQLTKFRYWSNRIWLAHKANIQYKQLGLNITRNTNEENELVIDLRRNGRNVSYEFMLFPVGLNLSKNEMINTLGSLLNEFVLIDGYLYQSNKLYSDFNSINDHFLANEEVKSCVV